MLWSRVPRHAQSKMPNGKGYPIEADSSQCNSCTDHGSDNNNSIQNIIFRVLIKSFKQIIKSLADVMFL